MPSPHVEDLAQDVCVPAIPPAPDSPPASIPKLHADALEKKLRALENRKPLETFVRLRAELPKVSSATDTRTQLKLLELIRNAAEPPVTSVEHVLRTTAVLPPLPETTAVAKAGCHLLGELTQAYLVAGQQLTRWSAPSLRRPLQIAIMRGIQLADAALRLSYRAYMPPPPAVWPTLHALYALAVQQTLESLPLTDEGPTPKGTYIGSILFAMADPSTMSPSEFDRVEHCIQRCASFARLTDPPPRAVSPDKPGTQFLIRQDGNLPVLFPPYMAGSEPAAGDKVLECRYILKEIQRLIAALEEALPPRQPGELTDAPVRSHVDTLHRLYRQWGVSRTKRTLPSRSHQHADFVCGFNSLWVMLAAAAATSARGEAFPNLLLPQEVQRSQWQILDESPGSMTLCHVEGDVGRMTVGELVGVRPHDVANPIVCVVRRARSNALGEFEIGVKAVAPRALPMTASIRADGETRQAKVIVLPRWPGQTEVTGILMPAGFARTGTIVHLLEGQWASACRVCEYIERAAGFDLVTIA